DMCDGNAMLLRRSDIALYVDLRVDDGGHPRSVVADQVARVADGRGQELLEDKCHGAPPVTSYLSTADKTACTRSVVDAASLAGTRSKSPRSALRAYRSRSI